MTEWHDRERLFDRPDGASLALTRLNPEHLHPDAEPSDADIYSA